MNIGVAFLVGNLDDGLEVGSARFGAAGAVGAAAPVDGVLGRGGKLGCKTGWAKMRFNAPFGIVPMAGLGRPC